MRKVDDLGRTNGGFFCRSLWMVLEVLSFALHFMLFSVTRLLFSFPLNSSSKAYRLPWCLSSRFLSLSFNHNKSNTRLSFPIFKAISLHSGDIFVGMGSACCVASRDTHQSNESRNGESQRNTICSPSGRLQWNNCQLLLAEMENPSRHSRERMHKDVTMDGVGYERGNISDQSSALVNLGTPISQKTPSYGGISTNNVSLSGDSEASMTSNRFPKINIAEQPETPSLPTNLLVSEPSSSYLSTPGEHSYPHLRSLPSTSTSSRRARRSPGHQLFRQISDSRILGLKSSNSYSLSESRPSFVLSNFSNDMVGGSSDGWSLRTFSELVTSSQKEHWSFDSEHFSSGYHKINESSGRFSYSPSLDLRTCGACLKVLTELSVASVLSCGHVYHAECLESLTTETDKYDPLCPICTLGQQQTSIMSKKSLRAEAESKLKFQRISRNRVMDSFLDREVDSLQNQNISRQGKSPKVGSSSSQLVFRKLFLKRHFTLGSKRSKPTENIEFSKKGFWGRYGKG